MSQKKKLTIIFSAYCLITITTTVAALWIVVTGNLNPSVVTMIICGAALIPVLVFTSLWLRVDRLLNPISRFLLLIGTIIKSKLLSLTVWNYK